MLKLHYSSGKRFYTSNCDAHICAQGWKIEELNLVKTFKFVQFIDGMLSGKKTKIEQLMERALNN